MHAIQTVNWLQGWEKEDVGQGCKWNWARPFEEKAVNAKKSSRRLRSIEE